ncbi:glucose-6-phosphate isomerase [Thermotomaculum hydrothermale]|uniref:Glucose-6-phosphate isomerase n=1 Tax=Thermotomaculum hydrothermale TaxID=981385 RepID=A0A7R6PN05_9BACT|nr:hypothetical protein [Thermotomaculum hydrothermale]BBB32091.1 glucose-6-phosphate isomerase [Thermotomaculum hydrothermale]
MKIKLNLRKLEHFKNDKNFIELFNKGIDFAEEIEKDSSIGFTELPDTDIYVEKAKAVAEKLPEGIDTLLVLGIGGSALGAKMVRDCFKEFLNKELIILDNVDPFTIHEIAKKINPEKTVINVISKSGSTVEPISQFKFFYNLFEVELGKEETLKRIVITTDLVKGNLRKLADELNLLSLEVPENVGGRFSVLTPVGIFPLEFCGIDTKLLLKGAQNLKKNGKEIAVTGAVLDYLFYNKGKNIKVLFIYSDRLYRFGEWYLQLFAESLGKRVDRDGNKVKIGATGVLAKGVTDQHSQVQLYKEGPDDKFFAFFKVNKKVDVLIPESFGEFEGFSYLNGKTFSQLMDAECEGTMQALENEEKPLILYEIEEIDLEAMGKLIYLFELQTAVCGYFYNINPFDQPGVEEGKIIAKKLLGYN